MRKIEIVKGTAFELDPDKVYLICFDRASLSMEDAYNLMKRLKIANGSVAVMTHGDPNMAVKVIEAPKPNDPVGNLEGRDGDSN